MLFVRDATCGLRDWQVTSRVLPFPPVFHAVYRRNDVDACEHGRGEAPQGVCRGRIATDKLVRPSKQWEA